MSVHGLRHDRPCARFSQSRGLSASVSFLSSPTPPALLLAQFFAPSLTLVPHSLLLNAQKRLLRRLTLRRKTISGKWSLLQWVCAVLHWHRELYLDQCASCFLPSLRSKRFQSSYCAKVKAEAKKKLKGEGEGRRGNTCPQTPRFWKTPLDISRIGSFVNWQLVKIET